MVSDIHFTCLALVAILGARPAHARPDTTLHASLVDGSGTSYDITGTWGRSTAVCGSLSVQLLGAGLEGSNYIVGWGEYYGPERNRTMIDQGQMPWDYPAGVGQYVWTPKAEAATVGLYIYSVAQKKTLYETDIARYWKMEC